MAAGRSGRLLYILAGVLSVLLVTWLVRPSNFALSNIVSTPATTIHDQDIPPAANNEAPHESPLPSPPHHESPAESLTGEPQPQPDEEQVDIHNALWDGSAYVQVSSSRMTPDKKWFPIDFGDYGSYNPNLIPHPWLNDTWVMIAQGAQVPGDGKAMLVYSLELVCDATYTDGKMQCLRSPISVPIASTVSDHCTGDLEWFNYMIGPNDPRVFLGPDRPYITYGSASQYTCLGQWIHDLRRLVRWNENSATDRTQRFFWPTELQRPLPYGSVEKNWFVFWDVEDHMYVHYDIFPKRAFARVSDDGTEITEDLAPLAQQEDAVCLEKYMPKLGEREHIHQATNSLAITLCKRDDSTCDPSNNTYIFTIFHHKQFRGNHNLYEPYIMLFQQTPPFAIHSISAKPFWINGRGKPGDVTIGSEDRPKDQSQMMYVTSMSWRERGLMYRGYLDDELMISFGVEDTSAGAIDVVVGELLGEMRGCD